MCNHQNTTTNSFETTIDVRQEDGKLKKVPAIQHQVVCTGCKQLVSMRTEQK